MLSWLREAEPALVSLDTWNAESNAHMVAVNEALGYRVLARETTWQRHLSAEADGNRTRQTEVLGLVGVEDRGGHQAP